MYPVFGTSWTRKGFSLLWDGATLANIMAPDRVISTRSFFSLVGNWPEDLPAVDGNTLVVAGLEACLDALTPDDAYQWLQTELKPAILSFQDEYEGQAGLIFWLPGGKERIELLRANNSYLWLCGLAAGQQKLFLGQALWAGAEADAGHLMIGSDEHSDLEGKDWIGLYMPRIS